MPLRGEGSCGGGGAPHRQQPTRPHCPWDSPGKNTGLVVAGSLVSLGAESEEELKSLFMKVKVESEKVGLKLNTFQ